MQLQLQGISYSTMDVIGLGGLPQIPVSAVDHAAIHGDGLVEHLINQVRAI